MTAEETPGLAEQHAEIRRARISRALRAFAGTIGVATLLFASFAIGSAFGPAPLGPIELALGFGVELAIGSAVAVWVVKRRLETGARSKIVLREGRRSVRLLAFDDYFTLGPEIVLRSAVISVEIEPHAVVLRYRDPRYEGIVLRELSGDQSTLSRAERALRGGGRDDPRWTPELGQD